MSFVGPSSHVFSYLWWSCVSWDDDDADSLDLDSAHLRSVVPVSMDHANVTAVYTEKYCQSASGC